MAAGALLAAAVASTGCVVVTRGNYGDSERLTGMTCAPTVTVAVALTLTTSGAQVGGAALRSSRDRLNAAVRSGMSDHACLIWTDDPAAADLVVDIRLHEDIRPRLWLATLSGLTLTLIPAVGTSRGTARVTVLRGETPLASRTWQDRTRMWIQMFLVFAMPAAGPKKTAERALVTFGDLVVGFVEATVAASPGLMPRIEDASGE
jgi:hypothetical protein